MRHRTLGWCAIALAGLVLITGIAFAGLIATERNNRFCFACHLHEEKFKRFTSVPFTDLSGPHRAERVRCIDCHGGADVVMRLRVWSIAAVDTGKFLVGRYREPDHMRLQLRPKECTQCHTPILKRQPALTAEQEEALEGRAGNAYHAIRPHDSVRTTCVQCHTSHTTDGDPKAQFIARKRVEPICRECHKTLGE
ncbi:MAG: cytochrome c3 family protein [Candidatus Rokubacteria bacterium]|nr:cytochrome c3 family protein [Candidatus Rokubacteria bacterium]